MSDYKKVSIDNLNKGALPELFEEALQKVLNNIADENTNPEAVREIKISIKITPSKNRDQAAIQISVDPKLAPIKSSSGFVLFNLEDDGIKAYTPIIEPEQPELPNVTPIIKKEVK